MKESLDFLKKLNIDKNVVLACSGGPDSMCLLHMLKNNGYNVICAHVNHNLRTVSEEEYKFVENYCKDNNIIFEGMKIQNYKNNKFTENEARKKRYDFFIDVLKKYNYKVLITAHHGDDLIETILMRIIRGSNLNGYKGFSKSSKFKNYLINNWKTIDINSTEGGVVGIGDVYKYSLNFFMLIVLSIVTIFLLFFVAIQMAKRVMEIALMKIVGPFCCTSLTNNQSKAFETWTKSTMGYFLITIVQFVCIGLLLNMFGSAIQDNGTLTGIFLIIGALLFVISTPTLISSLLGQQSGMMSAFGDMQSLLAIGSGVNAGLSLAKAGSMSALGMGANVVKGGANKISGGISNMFGGHGGGSLNKEQMANVQEKLGQHNSYGANQLVKQYTQENMKKKPTTSFTNSNPYKNPFSMQYNPIRNQYMSNSGLEANSNFDRKWY